MIAQGIVECGVRVHRCNWYVLLRTRLCFCFHPFWVHNAGACHSCKRQKESYLANLADRAGPPRPADSSSPKHNQPLCADAGAPAAVANFCPLARDSPKTAEQLSLKALLLVIGFLTHFRACNFEGVQLVE
jgi:hypothetical protein